MITDSTNSANNMKLKSTEYCIEETVMNLVAISTLQYLMLKQGACSSMISHQHPKPLPTLAFPYAFYAHGRTGTRTS